MIQLFPGKCKNMRKPRGTTLFEYLDATPRCIPGTSSEQGSKELVGLSRTTKAATETQRRAVCLFARLGNGPLTCPGQSNAEGSGVGPSFGFQVDHPFVLAPGIPWLKH